MTQEQKIDLDQLERKARADALALDGLHGDPSRAGNWIGNRDHARNVVALIARIRELENAFESSIDEWNRRDEYDLSTSYRSLMRALIEKGAVMP